VGERIILTDLQIIFLGTSASIPTSKRALSAVALRRKNELILFDCGEGTQRQMIIARIGFHKLTKIFITHMHGDHVLGLPGLLQTMSLLGREKKIQVYGPRGIKIFVEAINETIANKLSFPLQVYEKDFGKICEEKEYIVEAIKTIHIDSSFVYSFFEKPRPGRFNLKRARELEVPEGPLWSKLQFGSAVKLSDGRIVEPEMVLGEPRPGRKIVYTGDTGFSELIADFARNADLLIHEATFEDELRERAETDEHSTPSMAAKTAKRADAKRLVLTHISARYKDGQKLLDQAKRIFPNTQLAEDFLELEIPWSED
jgi:ribonuclease Z